MAVRLLAYVGLLLAGLVREGIATPARGLPAVLPLVVYNGKRPWNGQTDLASLFKGVPPSSRHYLPQLTYLLLDENRLAPADLDLPGNRVATLFRLEACAPEDLPALTAELAALLPRGEDPGLRREFTAWLLRLLRRLAPGVTIPEVADLEEIPMLEETLIEWWNSAEQKGLQRGRQEGRQEGRQAGQVQGMRQLLLQLLEERFGALPTPIRRRVGAISSAARLRDLAKRVLTARSLSEMGLDG